VSLLKLPSISRVRRNHGLEHATINVLIQRNPYVSLVGRSDFGGFHIVGEVETEDLDLAAREAYSRLQAGESELALHPRCGTTLATTGVLSGMAAFLVMGVVGRSRSRFRWEHLPEALIAATVAALLAQPLGILLQEHVTTTDDVSPLRIARVYKKRGGPVPVHRVETR
jgi:hypothetical protein